MEHNGLGNRQGPFSSATSYPGNFVQELLSYSSDWDSLPEFVQQRPNGFSGDQALESALSRLTLSSDSYQETPPSRNVPASLDDVARLEADLDYYLSYGLRGQGFSNVGLHSDIMGFQNGGQDSGSGGAQRNLMVDPGSWDCGPGTLGSRRLFCREPFSGGGDESQRLNCDLNINYHQRGYDQGYSSLLCKQSRGRPSNSQFPNFPSSNLNSMSRARVYPPKNGLVLKFSNFLRENLCNNRHSYESSEQFNSLSLLDMVGRIVSLAKDQNGSRILQEKLDNPNKEDIEIMLSEVLDHIADLMKNQSGSYFVQKLFGVCSKEQRTRIIMAITKSSFQLVGICFNPHGARAMQKLMENLSTPEQISFVMSALSSGVVRLANDPSGQHVIRYCLIHYSHEYTKHLLNEIANNCYRIATDKNGCCVLQCCVEHARGETQEHLMKEIIVNALYLAEDPYGNYVVQHLLGLKIPRVTADLLRRLQGHFVSLSCNKYASNVVEKFLESQEEHTTKIIMELLTSPNAAMLLLDPFGNFVIQKALSVSKGHVFYALRNLIQANTLSMHNNIYGKKILARFNKRKGQHV